MGSGVRDARESGYMFYAVRWGLASRVDFPGMAGQNAWLASAGRAHQCSSGNHMKITRKLRREMTQSDAAETKVVNNALKARERSRRDARMIEKLKSGSLPYTPVVMSWLSRKLDVKASRITENQVKTLIR